MTTLGDLKRRIFGKQPEVQEVIDGKPVMYGNNKVERIVSTDIGKSCDGIPTMQGIRITSNRNETIEVRFTNRSGVSDDGPYDWSRMEIFHDGKSIEGVSAKWTGHAVAIEAFSMAKMQSPFKWAYKIANTEARKYEEACKVKLDERQKSQDKKRASDLARKKAISDKFFNR